MQTARDPHIKYISKNTSFTTHYIKKYKPTANIQTKLYTKTNSTLADANILILQYIFH